MAAKKTRSKPQKGVVAIVPNAKQRPSTPQKGARKPISPSRNPPPPRKSWLGWLFSIILQSCVIYSLYQYIWTCPKDGSDSRTICDLGDRTLDIVEPYAYDAYDTYIEPYYTEYLSPHVDKATPYIVLATEQYIQPVYTYVADQFERNGRPHLAKAQGAFLAQYTRSVEPHVKQLEARGWLLYDAYLADLVATGREVYDAYAPTVQSYANQGYSFALEKAHPYYVAALPYLEAAWEQGIETAGWVGVEGKGWVARRWGMHVEPQLWRIQERLGLKGFAKNATPVKESEPTPRHHSNPNASSSDIRPDANIDTEDRIAAEADEGYASEGDEKPKEKKRTSAQQIEDARAEVEADLVSWALKFEEAGAAAAAEVVRELDKLCDGVLKEQNQKSTELLEYVEKRIEKEFLDFEDDLVKLLDSPAELKYVMMGYDGMVGAAFGNLKGQQTSTTEYTQGFLMDTYQATAKIVDAALADMDSAHDLGMQELGMKWAWMDGVTYKDWAKYHELKQTFGAMKTKVIKSGQGHKGLREVTDYAKLIDDTVAEAVKLAHLEISKLQKVGRERLTDAANARDGAQPGESTEKVRIDNQGQVVEEVPQSEAKEVPEPKGEKEGLPEPAEDESNQPPDQGQKQSERQEAAPERNEPRSEEQQQTTSEKQPEPEFEAKAKGEGEGSSPEAEAQQPEPEAQAEPAAHEAKGEAEPRSEPQIKARAKSRARAKEPESKPEPEPESKPETEPESKSNPETEPEAKSEAKSESKSDPEADPESKPEPEAKRRSAPEEAESKPVTAAKEEPEPKVQKEPVHETEAQQPKLQVESAAAAESKPEPKNAQTEAAHSGTEPTAEEPAVDAQRGSHQEDTGVKEDEPVGKPNTPPHSHDEKVILKDEL
ncbi:hypothetical protein DRE_04521 [Drechslerella stenobrocha 248]|uniref:Uncharacterized protein n=1 Tax=Drechslerella stenobrocha 248 TaxID=1043628 RepID=W7IB80_9PEZI|nr:hypothetical protein DRE_04521 [Drechslerella stenobrocha 248]